MESTLLQKVKSLRRLKIHWNSNKNVAQKLHPNWQPIEKRVGEGGGGQWTQYLLIPAATKRRGLRKVENKRLKIDMVHEPSINHRLIPATGRVPQKERSDRTLSSRSTRRGRGSGISGFSSGGQSGGGQRVPRPGSRVSPNNLSSGSAPPRLRH